MPSEIQQIGGLFRQKREEKHLSLKECENSTSIRASFLQAIEQGNITELLSKVYALGFIKQYAEFLNVDLQQISKEYPRAFDIQSEEPEFTYGIGTLETRGSLGGGIKWLPNVLWATLAGFIIVLAYYLAKAIGVL